MILRFLIYVLLFKNFVVESYKAKQKLIFQVNELEFIAKQISESQEVTEDGSNSDKGFEEDSECSEYNNKLVEVDSDCEEIIPDTQNNNQLHLFDEKDISDTEFEKGPSVECCSVSNDSEQELEPTLYEDLSITNETQNLPEPLRLSPTNSCRMNGATEEEEIECISKLVQRDQPLHSNGNEAVMDNKDCNAPESKTMLYEQCCDFLNDESRKSPSTPCPRQPEETDERYSSDSTDVESKVGQCLKVYTHKKRKSINKIRNHLLQINELLPELPTTKSIDLLNDSSSDETSLNLENSEYVSNLTSENIQSIVGCTLNEFNMVDSDGEMNVCTGFFPSNDKSYVVDSHKEIRKVEDFFAGFDNDRLTKPPILRRSVRLSQQESEESTEDNLFALAKTKTHKIRIIDRDRSVNNVNIFAKRKRKRHSERRVQDIRATPTQNRKHTRPLRRASKLAKYRSKTRLSPKIEKEKLKTLEKSKEEKSTRDEVENHRTKAVQLNTIATVNRALWGDMTDVSEESNSKDLEECSPSMEIPFAVGLLPLRAALEKMQAMPDYQPRKTRSSVAPIKQDVTNLKRKNNHLEITNGTKKHVNSESIVKENAKTVCHIEIRTAAQCARSRKRSLSDSSTVQSTAVTDRQ